jgi:hypothetical protein
MKIVRILPKLDALLSVKLEGKEDNEFNILFDHWNNIEFFYNFFRQHKKDLGRLNIKEAVEKSLNDAKQLENKLLETAEGSNKLRTLFQPLSNSEYKLKPYQKSKAYGMIRRSWLRIYAIRIYEDLFVVTGGAIKLTQTMQERQHTQEQLYRLNRVRNYLKDQGFSDTDLDNLEIIR